MIALVVVAGIGCSKSESSDRCARGVGKVFELTTNPVPGAKPPSAEEQAVIDDIKKLSTKACESEGLSEAQLECILAMKTFDDMKTVASCPAIKANHPSWLLAN